jgi:hypothetical protein
MFVFVVRAFPWEKKHKDLLTLVHLGGFKGKKHLGVKTVELHVLTW